MEIELERTALPEEMMVEACAICGDDFEAGTVTAWARTDDRSQLGGVNSWACPACVEALGAYRPDRFPTIEEYRRLEAQWPTPKYASSEEANEAWLAGRD